MKEQQNVKEAATEKNQALAENFLCKFDSLRSERYVFLPRSRSRQTHSQES